MLSLGIRSYKLVRTSPDNATSSANILMQKTWGEAGISAKALPRF